MASARDTAAYLTHLAQSGEERDPLTPLRLQKLLYYVQGWFLAVRKVPAFPERIEAWAHGPVVPDIYHELKQFGGKSFVIDIDALSPVPDLSDDERSIADEVWESYKDYSASKLREMTHREEPWVNARRGYGPADRCNVEITPDALAAYFGKLAA